MYFHEYTHHHSDKAVSRFIYSKCCLLEEELKTVIAATRSLEAQVEKVRRAWSTFPDAALRPRTRLLSGGKQPFNHVFFKDKSFSTNVVEDSGSGLGYCCHGYFWTSSEFMLGCAFCPRVTCWGVCMSACLTLLSTLWKKTSTSWPLRTCLKNSRRWECLFFSHWSTSLELGTELQLSNQQEVSLLFSTTSCCSYDSCAAFSLGAC